MPFFSSDTDAKDNDVGYFIITEAPGAAAHLEYDAPHVCGAETVFFEEGHCGVFAKPQSAPAPCAVKGGLQRVSTVGTDKVVGGSARCAADYTVAPRRVDVVVL